MAQSLIRRFTRTPAQAATKTLTNGGVTGLFVNGVAMFDNRDALSYNTSTGTESNNGQGIWSRDAWINEGVTFDPGYAHQPQNGQYHYHAHPPALRYQLGDNASYNPATNTYGEDVSNLHHSPVLAWAADGFPVYGPYGYASAMDASSAVRRMVSGFVPRDGNNGTDNLTQRTTIPAWAARAQNRAAALASTQYGPAVSATYLRGRYLEDNACLGDLANPATGQPYQMGVHFDLNEFNCRYGVTPEFPAGTWAYFCTITASGAPAFPYAMGRQYLGTPDLTALTAIPGTATTVFKGGPDTAESMKSAVPAAGNVTITSNAVEGGTYQVDASSDLSTWSSLPPSVTASGASAQKVETSTAARRFYRVTRSALATYFSGGTTGGGGTVTASPATGSRGASNLTVTFTISATATPPPPPVSIVPSSVTIGTIAGTNIAHTAANTVTAHFSIPAGAATGAQTATIAFPGPGGGAGPSYTQAAAFTVN